MKKRKGFVSNSSSSSFIITNKTDKDLTYLDFIKENPHLVDNKDRDYYTTEQAMLDAKNRNDYFPAHSTDEYIYDDNGEGALEYMFRYELSGGGESESFKWKDSDY